MTEKSVKTDEFHIPKRDNRKRDEFHIRGGGDVAKLLRMVCELYGFSYDEVFWPSLRLYLKVLGPDLGADIAFMLAADNKAEKHVLVEPGLTHFRVEGFIVVAEALQQLLHTALDPNVISKEELVKLQMVWHSADQEIEKALGKFLSAIQPAT